MSRFNEAQFAELSDGMDAVVELIVGFRSKCEAKGFSPRAAELLSVQFGTSLMRTMAEPSADTGQAGPRGRGDQ